MGKHNQNENPVEETAVVDGAAAGTVTEAKGDQRFIKYNVPQKDGTVLPQNRPDIIRGLWKGESDTPAVGNLNPEGKKWSRGDIARKLSELAGTKVIYQIVFAATKGIPGGPDKVEAAPAAEAPQG